MSSEHAIALFLVDVALLLLTSRVLGELARKVGMPAVAGELAAGVVLGPTILGRVVPGSTAALFPAGASQSMLSGYTLLASVLLLTLAGLEIDLSVVIHRRREAALTSVAGVILPFLLGTGLGLLLPETYLVEPSRRWLFAFFLGTALSISAMPVIAKTLLDLGIFRTDLGLLVIASAMVDDLIGWLLFSLLVGPMKGQAASWQGLATRVALVAVFVAVVLLAGRKAIDALLGWLDRERLSAPGRVLSLVFVLAITGAAVTQSIGIHAVFGAFIVGVAVGDSPRLRAETRAQIHEFVSNVFAPVFFAAVGLRVDFIRSFDLPLVVAVLVVACVAKVVGCSLGARVGGLKMREALSVGFAMNSRGAMEIILALIALEAGLIRTELFVALVVMALVTSLLAGPMLHRLLRARPRGDVRSLLEEGAVLLDLRARSAEQAVRELAADLAAARSLDGSVMADAVLEFGTDLGGLQDGVALPMARIHGLPATMLAFGRSDRGLDFNAVDGKPAHLVFLLLVPESAIADATEVQAAVVRLVETGAQRQLLLGAASRSELLDAIHRATALATPLPVPSPVSPPLAGTVLGRWLDGCSLRGRFAARAVRCAGGSLRGRFAARAVRSLSFL